MKIDIKELETVTLKQGQVLVVTLDHHITIQQQEKLMDMMKKIFPNNKILVVDTTVKLSVMESQCQS